MSLDVDWSKRLPSSCYREDRELVPHGILVHFISARNVPGADRYDTDAICQIFIDWKVSAHYLIKRDGTILGLVPKKYQAWHAGKSKFKGTSGLNATFIGIELEGADDEDFEEAQYEALSTLCVELMEEHNIPTKNIRGHEDVSGIEVRTDYKTDPGQYFDWVKLGCYIQRTKDLASDNAIEPSLPWSGFF